MNMHTVGDVLKQARLAAGASMDDVAKRLYVKSNVIQAIENNNFDAIPSSAAIKGLIQNYAKLLGLNPAKMLALYRRQRGPDKVKLTHVDKPVEMGNWELTPIHVALGTLLLVALGLIIYLVSAYLRVVKYPSLVLSSPKTNVVKTTEPKYKIQGVVEPNTILTINGIRVNYDDKGNFEYEIPLEPGENNIEIQVVREYNPDKKTIKKLKIIYTPENQAEQNKQQEQAASPNGPGPINFTVKVTSDIAWIQVVVDNVQKDIGIKSAGYSRKFTAKQSMYVLTGRPSITKVTVNQKPIQWKQDGNTIKIECNLQDNRWICNGQPL